MASGATKKATKATDLLARALAAYRANDLAAAERLTAAALRLRPDDLQGTMLKAAIAFSRGRFADAADGLRLVLARQADNREAAANLGVALAQLNQFAECYAVLRRSEPWTGRPDIQLVLAQAAIATGAEDAETQVAAAERGRANPAAAALLRGELEKRRGHWRESFAACARGADLSRDDPVAMTMLLEAAHRIADDVELARIAERARRSLQRASNEALAWQVAAADVKFGRIDAAEACLLDTREKNPAPLVSWNGRIDRLVVAEQYDRAVALLETAVPACLPPQRPSHASAAARRTAAPLTRIVVDNAHQVMKAASVDDIVEACGVPVQFADLRGASPDAFAAQDTLVICAGGLDAGQIEAVRAIKAAGPRCTVAAWHFDNHHCYLWNALLAAAVDLSFPAHATPRAYLARWARDRRCGPIVPLCVTQWPRPVLEALYADCRDEPRADALTGHFAYFPIARKRNLLIDEARRRWPEAELTLGFGFQRDYHAQSARDRFLSWRRYKTSVALPVAGDLSNRFFDALASGQVPIVPRDGLDFDRVIPPAEQERLPVVRLEAYSLEALRAAHASAIAAFDRGGEAQAAERHRFALAHHMLADRIRDIVTAAKQLLGRA